MLEQLFVWHRVVFEQLRVMKWLVGVLFLVTGPEAIVGHHRQPLLRPHLGERRIGEIEEKEGSGGKATLF